MTENLYTTAIKNLLDRKIDMAMVLDGDSYESVVVEVDGDGNDIEKPTEEEVCLLYTSPSPRDRG